MTNKICNRCNEDRPLIKFKKYETKDGTIKYVNNCIKCASFALKLAGKLEKQANPTCKHCSTNLEVGENWSPSMKQGCSYLCKSCHKGLASQSPAVNKASKLQKSYGITLEEYNNMYTEQGGLCAICKRPEEVSVKKDSDSMFLPVDHDHITGKVRGLLCTKCNRGIGLLGDSIVTLESAIEYLKKGGISG